MRKIKKKLYSEKIFINLIFFKDTNNLILTDLALGANLYGNTANIEGINQDSILLQEVHKIIYYYSLDIKNKCNKYKKQFQVPTTVASIDL